MFLLAFAESIQLFPDGTLVIHIALILLMIWALNKTLFGPINRVLESRARHSGSRNPEAEEILSDADEKQRLYEQEMLAARSEGYELIERNRSEAVAAKTQKVSSVKAETAEILESGTKSLQEQAAAAREALAREAESMAEKISSNILKA